MKLRPVIASYSYGAGASIRQYLNDSVLEVIADIAYSPKAISEVSPDMLAELVEMHVLKEEAELVRLDTSVFLRNDIERILDTVTPLAKEIGERVLSCGASFRTAPPEITIFLGGIIGFVQGSNATAQKAVGVDWKNYPGKYAQTKVDFDEECEIFDAVSPDFLNKYVIPGERYTAVFIGPPEGTSFHSFLPMGISEPRKEFIRNVNYFLVDAYAMLVEGEIRSDSLRISAEIAKMYKQGHWRTAVITNDTVRKYQDGIYSVMDVTSSFYAEKLDTLDRLLRSTIAGQQGVPPANMMLNLWRYIRKITARELYACGFLTDDIREEGTLTVFYENDVELIRQLLL